MTFQSDHQQMTPKDRAVYGFARCRDVAFDAVRNLWRRRSAEGMTQKQIAEAIGKDTGWVSKNLRGPGNWTLRTIGAFVEALNGEIEISIRAIEDPVSLPKNYHAYVGYEPKPLPRIQPAAPPRATNAPLAPPICDVLEQARRGGSSSPVPAA